METLASYSNPHHLQLPVNFKEEDIVYFQPHFNYELLEPEVIALRNVFYFRNGVIAKINGNKIKKHLPWAEWGNHLKNNFWVKRIGKAILKNDLQFFRKSKIKYAIVINPFSDNYFHWLTEVLPKLIYLKEKLDHFKVFLPKDCNKEYQLDTLKLLQINFSYLKKDTAFFSRVFICSPFAKYPGFISKESMFKIRDIFKYIETKNEEKKRIYISRKQVHRRNVLNEEELMPVLIRNGFEIIYPETLSFLGSVALFKNAEILISIHGAALTNMIFLPKRSTVFELKLEKILTDKCYYILANVAGMKYYYQNCKSIDVIQDHIHSNIIVDVNEFESNLRSIIAKSTKAK
ncbi:MAG: glycosyltransferase family 61 protein [Ginsengibacter sp.]